MSFEKVLHQFFLRQSFLTFRSQPTKKVIIKKRGPKKLPKCIYGTPDPLHNCGPEISGNLMVREWTELSETLWKLYYLSNSYKF